jgi:integrase
MAVLDGVRHKLVKGPKDAPHREAAKRRLRELQAVRDKSPTPDAEELTVAGVIELYLRHAGKLLDERTLYERKLYLQWFAEAHGFRKANDLDAKPFHLTSWLQSCETLKSDWTKAHVVAIVQRPFNWAVRQRLIAANPFRGVSHRQGQARRPLTDEEFDALVVAADPPRKAPKDRYPSGRKVAPSDRRRKPGPTPGQRFVEFIRFLRLTGARTCEAARLRWTDIGLENATIVMVKHKTARMQRTPKPRVIPLVPEIVQLLIAIRARQEPGEFVFYTHRGTCWNRCNLSLRMQRARDAAKIPDDAKLYGLRHRFGTTAILNGVDIRTLAELMGHTTTRTTEGYIHLAGKQSHLAAAMRKATGQDQAP